MEYERHHITFISRTMQLLNQYQTSIIGKVPKSEEFEVTLLINCLLGLLIVPKEQCYDKIPLKDFVDLHSWGILPEYVTLPDAQVNNLRQLVRLLRNCTAHGSVTPKGNGREITDLIFEDNQSDFRAIIPVKNLKLFVTKLCESVQR